MTAGDTHVNDTRPETAEAQAAPHRWVVFRAAQPSRLAWAGLLAAGLALASLVGLLQAGSPALGAFCLFAALTPLLIAVDLAEHRLPDVITLPLAGLCLIAVTTGAVISGDWSMLVRAVLSAAGLTAVFSLLFFLGAGSGFGFGDVKLALSIGLCLGAIAPLAVLIGPFLGFLLAAVVGLVLMLTGRATRSSAIALGPYLLAGTLIVIVATG